METTTNADRAAAEVIRAVACAQDVAEEEVRGEMSLQGELGVESLAMIEISVALEEALGFRTLEIESMEALDVVTVDDLIALVARELNRQAA